MKSVKTVLAALFLWGAAMPQTLPAAGGNVSSGISILHSFGAFTNGANPQAPLALGRDGNFYGTTSNGGTNGGNGTVFKITPGGTLTSLYSFTGGNDGANPSAALAQGWDGNFYGVTSGGGTNGGYGTIFRITAQGAFTTLYSFTGGADGSSPGSLTQGSDGAFYGTTSGSLYSGTVFRITTKGALKTLASITAASSLVEGRDGNFYGTTFPDAENGTVFKMTPGGVVTTLYSFGGGDDGWGPNGLVEGGDGNFYGTTLAGGINGFSGFGTVFKITPGGAFATLYSFTNGLDSGWPQTTLTRGSDGNLYGTTPPGGGEYYDGTFFRITPGGAFTVLYSFPGGVNSASALALGNDGCFYATAVGPDYNLPIPLEATAAGARSSRAATAGKSDAASSGINTITNGSVFKITPGGRFSNLYSFTGLDDGANPQSILKGRDGNFYGTSSRGGNSELSLGGIFKATTNGALSILYPFPGGGMSLNNLSIVQGSDGSFYGTEFVSYGFPLFAGQGSVFSLTPGGQFANLFSFDNGTYALAPLVEGSDGNFYGTTAGGQFSFPQPTVTNIFSPPDLPPAIFSITTNGSYTSLYAFTNGIDGSGPSAALVQGRDGNLYGSLPSGGDNGYGAIFQVTTNGALAILYSFTNGDDGAGPVAALALGNDGDFYGSTANGGSNNDGTIFKITTNGILTSLYSFTNGVDGANLQSALVPGSDGNFYGYTPGGGTDGSGAVFQITPSGAFHSMYSFAGGNDGANVNSLAQGNDGNFYGTTANGGAGASGTLFRLSLGLPPLAPPSITREPPGQVREPEGAVLTLSATVSGMPPLSYQWQSKGRNLSDGENISGSTGSALTISPVMLSNSGTYRLIVRNNYGAVTSTVTSLAVSVDTVAPTISISSPASNSRATNGAVSGTASDNARVVAVNYWLTNYNNGVTGAAGQAILGLGTTNRTWTIPGAPLPGSNDVMVQSVDFAGNKSPVRARAFFYEVSSLFTLTRTGNGTVAGTASIPGDVPPTNGAMLHIGESYTLVATPARNWWFSNWTSAGSVAGASATLRFVMEPGYSVAASFVTNFFLLAAGTYNGLFYSTNVPAAETAGFLKNLVVSTSGAFSGVLLTYGSTNLLSGTFNGRFHFSGTIARSAQQGGPLILTLNLGAGQITGAVSGTNNGGWTNGLTAYRSAGSGGSGQYTVLIPPPSAATNCPPGDGYVLITNHAGEVVLTGALADGTPFSQCAPISASGAVPVYQNLATNNPSPFGSPAFLYGWINLNASPPDGWLAWIRKTWTEPPAPTNGAMPLALLGLPVDWQGFTNVSTLIGSAWTNPPAGTPAIPAFEDIGISGGSLAPSLGFIESLNTSNVFVPAGTPVFPSYPFSGSMDPKTGWFTITFGSGSGNTNFVGAGAVLQNSESGGGYFVGPGEGQLGDGSITLQQEFVIPLASP